MNLTELTIAAPVKTVSQTRTASPRKTFARGRTLLAAAASLCLMGGAYAPARASSVIGPPATPAPSVTLAPPGGAFPSTGPGGASVPLTGTVTSPAGKDLTVVWTLGGAVVQTVTVPGAAALTGAPIAYSHPYAPGTYTVVVTVTDGSGAPPARATVTVTVLPPANTSGGKVTGGGNIALGSEKGTFGFVAKTNNAGSPQGNFVFQDHATGRTVKSLEITGLIVSGPHAEFWGTAMIDDDGEYGFIVDVNDFAEPGAGADTFVLQLSDGYSAGGTILGGGNIQVHK